MRQLWNRAVGLLALAVLEMALPGLASSQTSATVAADFSESALRASRVVLHAPGTLPNQPLAVFNGVDMMNIFIVIEAGDHHVTILDGEKFEPVHRFRSRDALLAEPRFSPDGRYLYLAARDGWISKFDLWNLKVVTEIRAGLETQGLAISGDGKILAAGNGRPHTLVLLDADLNPLKVHAVKDRDGKSGSRILAVVDSPSRRSFVAALQDVAELWEISYNPLAEEVPVGMIHDFRYREGAFIPGYLNPRRTTLAEPLTDFFLGQEQGELIGASGASGKGQVVNLDVRKKIAELDLPGSPGFGGGIAWTWQGKAVMATPHLRDGIISISSLTDWKVIRTIKFDGPGRQIASHEKTPYAWADATTGKARDRLMIIDKRTLEAVAELRPAPGKNIEQVAFTRDGRFALASLAERKSGGGAIVVFDAATLKEIKRIPMDQPVGLSNIGNRARQSGAPGPVRE